jgi:uroporphyrin-III C-methyltransferase
MAETAFDPGTVWIVGAGPGDPDLLTRKAERLIGAASVFFHDALVGGGVLALAPPGAACVAVGKRSGRHSRSQDAINALLVEAALRGERVVRLKGGDPAVFARTGEEVAALRRRGIAVRICPGVTAASAAAASAGVSLTLRGVARRLTLVTGHVRTGEKPPGHLVAAADRDATLAIYMGKAAASGLARALMLAGRPGDTPALIVADASLPSERVLSTRLDLLGLAAASLAGDGPMILLVGDALAPAAEALGPDLAAALSGALS